MTSLTLLWQAIHDAPLWHQAEQFQNPADITIIPLQGEALSAVIFALVARKAPAGETIHRLKQALAEYLMLIFKKQT